MSSLYAVIEEKSARLDSEFGEKIARQWFGDEAVDSMPKYVRGPKTGKPKGYVVWKKVARGGWVRHADGTGYVENRKGHVFEKRLCSMEYNGANVIGEIIVQRD